MPVWILTGKPIKVTCQRRVFLERQGRGHGAGAKCFCRERCCRQRLRALMGTSASEGLLVRFHTLVLQNKAEGNTKKLCKKKKKKRHAQLDKAPEMLLVKHSQSFGAKCFLEKFLNYKAKPLGFDSHY